MKLLKLIPDNTNLDFMRWRNVALILSIIVTIASLALVGIKGLNLGVDFVGGQVVRDNLRPAGQRRGIAPPGECARHRRGQHPGVRRAAHLPDPPAQARGRRCRRQPGRHPGADHDPQVTIPGARVDAGRIGVRQGQRGAGPRRCPGDHPGDDRHRPLHLVPVRMAVRRRRAGDPVPRRVDDARLLLR